MSQLLDTLTNFETSSFGGLIGSVWGQHYWQKSLAVSRYQIAETLWISWQLCHFSWNNITFTGQLFSTIFVTAATLNIELLAVDVRKKYISVAKYFIMTVSCQWRCILEINGSLWRAFFSSTLSISNERRKSALTFIFHWISLRRGYKL